MLDLVGGAFRHRQLHRRTRRGSSPTRNSSTSFRGSSSTASSTTPRGTSPTGTPPRAPSTATRPGHVTVGGQSRHVLPLLRLLTRAAPPAQQAPGRPSPALLLSENPILRELCDDYGRRLRGRGFLDRQRDFVAPFATPRRRRADSLIRRLVRDEISPSTDSAGPRPPGWRGPRRRRAPRGSAERRGWRHPDPQRPVGGLGRLLAMSTRSAGPPGGLPRGAATATSPDSSTGPRSSGCPRWASPSRSSRYERERAAKAKTATRRARIRRRSAGAATASTAWRRSATSPPTWDSAGPGRLFVSSLQHAGIPVSTSTYSRTSSRLGARLD